MTRINPAPLSFIAVLLLAVCLTAAGCFAPGGGSNEPEQRFDEKSSILRTSSEGPIVITFAVSPMLPGVPPDGIRAAMQRSIGNRRCSAATFLWSERERIRYWLRDQAEQRRSVGAPIRLILAGHGLGATEASELAKDVLFKERDIEIVLLLTVDAIKTNRLGSAAAVTGNALTKRIPGVDPNFTAYDAAPPPDGKRLWSHINYYQSKSTYYHGVPMPHAENHRLDDWTGLLNHSNADEFAHSFLVADIRQAMDMAANGGRR